MIEQTTIIWAHLCLSIWSNRGELILNAKNSTYLIELKPTKAKVTISCVHLPQSPVSCIWHRGLPRHPEGVGWASWEWDVSEGGERLPAAWGDPLHSQRCNHSVWDWLLHHQVRLCNRLLQWVYFSFTVDIHRTHYMYTKWVCVNAVFQRSFFWWRLPRGVLK